MEEKVMSREVAVQELNKWYDEIGVSEDLRLDVDLGEDEEIEGEAEERTKKREKDDTMRETVLRAMMSGSLILNEEKKLQYTLKDPIFKKDSQEVHTGELIFKNRYRTHELEAQMKGVKPDEFMPMMRAYIATLTGVPKAILGKLYNRDMQVAQAIYSLFSRGEA